MSQSALSAKPGGSADAAQVSAGPKKAGLVLATLIIVAAVANLPLAMANVALPSIGAYFDASQTQLNLVAVAYSLGLACSVLWPVSYTHLILTRQAVGHRQSFPVYPSGSWGSFTHLSWHIQKFFWL